MDEKIIMELIIELTENEYDSLKLIQHYENKDNVKFPEYVKNKIYELLQNEYENYGL